MTPELGPAFSSLSVVPLDLTWGHVLSQRLLAFFSHREASFILKYEGLGVC